MDVNGLPTAFGKQKSVPTKQTSTNPTGGATRGGRGQRGGRGRGPRGRSDMLHPGGGRASGVDADVELDQNRSFKHGNKRPYHSPTDESNSRAVHISSGANARPLNSSPRGDLVMASFYEDPWRELLRGHNLRQGAQAEAATSQ